MRTIKVYLTDEQYEVIQQDANNLGLQISSYLRFLALNKGGAKIKQSTVKIDKTDQPEKPKKVKMTPLDKLMWDYTNAYPNCKVFIENGKIIFQDRQNGNRQQIVPVPPEIEGDQNKYPEGDSIPVVKFERTDQPEFDEFIRKEGSE